MSLPEWLEPLYEAAEMRAADEWAIERRGIPGVDLMERAGVGLARVTAVAAERGPVRVVCGKGNNGGDGLVVARLLREEGREVDVLAVGDLSETKGDARANLDRLTGDPPRPFTKDALEGSGAIVDAMLGTGFEGAPREPVAGAIKAINDAQAVVVACDVPSGVNASTGEVEADAVRARVTATFHGPKIGLYVDPGKGHAGRVEVIEIGIPRDAPLPVHAGLIADAVLTLVPPRPRSGTKFKSGVVVIAGGARGLTGAPTMAALAAMRTGAGYVQVAVPKSTEPTFDLKLMEAMTHAMPEDDGAHVPESADRVLELCERAGALVLGPGIGRTDGAFEWAREVARRAPVPVLIDADGLNAHAGELDSLRAREAPTVLTPHEGELGRLLGIESDAVQARRLECAREAAERSGCIVVLKGDDSIVATPEGIAAVSPGATPALATAGTGDVLSGLTGALLSKGMEPLEAAAAGVLAHARAGKVAASRLGANHVIAGDVIEAIPEAMA
jgi:ADP-dependent NAD(P)H-hydrate dehydratase / NAD(P)H-hydrate epimerase